MPCNLIDAIDYLKTAGDPNFQNSDSNVIGFIVSHLLFKNTLCHQFKSAINIHNFMGLSVKLYKSFFYLKLLKIEGMPIYCYERKTFLFGFSCCIYPIKEISTTLLYRTENALKYILTYKISQDHEDLFFSCNRLKG